MTKKKTTTKADATEEAIRTLQREIGILVADSASSKAAVASLQIKVATAEQAIAGLKAEHATLAARMRSLVNSPPPAQSRFAVVRRLLGGRR